MSHILSKMRLALRHGRTWSRFIGMLFVCWLSVARMGAGQQPLVVDGPLLIDGGVEWAPPPPNEVWRLPAAEPTIAVHAAADHNLKLRLSERIINHVVETREDDAGPVNEVILGAQVTGEQQTRTLTTADLRPSDQYALLNLNLRGVTDNLTVGVTPQAAVHTSGHYEFLMTKPVEFDGRVIRTRKPSAVVNPKSETLLACPRLGRVPLIGPIVGRIAFQTAQQRQPEAEQIAAFLLTEQAAPEFNAEVDRQLADLNRAFTQQVRTGLQQRDLTPDHQHVFSTDDSFVWNVQFGEAVPDRSPPAVTGDIVISVHESLPRDFLARVPLEGLEITTGELNARIQQLIARFSGIAEPVQEETPADLTTLRLADEEPLRVQFQNNRLLITVFASVTPTVGGSLPMQRIEIPIEIVPEGEEYVFRAGTVTSEAVDPDAAGDPLGIIRTLLIKQIQDRLQPRRLPRSYPLPLPDRTLTLRTQQVLIKGGWLSVVINDTAS